MEKIRLIHWKAAEAGPLLEALRGAGYQVDYEPDPDYHLAQAIRAAPPAAVVIDLSRLPSHGREIAIYLRGSKSTRQVPLVFVNGLPEKVGAVREKLPDAAYTTTAALLRDLRRAIREAPAAPVVPPQMMERSSARPAAQKLGIKPGSRVALLDPPRDYARVLGELPAGVSLVEDAERACEVVLWFVHDAAEYQARLAGIGKRAAGSKLWILWRKRAAAGKGAIGGQTIRDCALAVGLVDYKICAVNATWSALAFARKAR